MKKISISRGIQKVILGLALTLGFLINSKSEASAFNGVSFQVFYDALTPYGDWVRDARHGYIWLPSVYDDFHPYGSNGRWVMTQYGNTWVSDYDWGWAPFHYGRWYFDDFYQSWAWIPGYEWAPAWVSWRTGGGYYGWAPMGPGISIGVRVNIPVHHWLFIPHARIYHTHPYHYYAPYHSRMRIINRTTFINNTIVYNNYNYYGGPSHREVQQTTRRVVPVYNVRNSEAPGRMDVSRNEVRLYRPDLDQTRGRTVDARPSRVLDADQARTARSSRQVSPTSPEMSTQPGRTSSSPNDRVNRSQNPNGRSASPSTRDQGFEMRPAPSGTERNAPARTSQPRGARQENMRSPQPMRESQVRTQPQPDSRGTMEQRRYSPSREPQIRESNTRTQPQMRTSSPRQSDSRVSQPSRSPASQPQMRTSAPSRRESSAPSRSSGSSSRGGRGNNE